MDGQKPSVNVCVFFVCGGGRLVDIIDQRLKVLENIVFDSKDTCILKRVFILFTKIILKQYYVPLVHVYIWNLSEFSSLNPTADIILKPRWRLPHFDHYGRRLALSASTALCRDI